ncbi:unnamed protein product [Chrysoparadoxa australica]
MSEFEKEKGALSELPAATATPSQDQRPNQAQDEFILNAGAMEEEDKPVSSFDNILPKENLAKGLETAKSLLGQGWLKVTQTANAVAESETVQKMREKTEPALITCMDKAGDGFSKVGDWTGRKMEEARPTIELMKEKSVAGLGVAKEEGSKLIEEVRKRTGGGGGTGAGGGSDSTGAGGPTIV